MTEHIKDVLNEKLDGKDIELKGWLYNKRSSGGVEFLLIRDGTGIIQATVHKDEVDEKIFENAKSLTQESSIIVKGIVNKDERAAGGYEIKITGLKIIQIAEEYPLGKKEHNPDFLMNNRHLWIRASRQIAILKVRAEVIRASREFLDSNDFVGVDTPILTPSCCEDTSTLFETPYFGKKAFLAQSGQLYNEANIFSFGNVYCFGPTFRAEKSKTTRHLTEFWMLEPEMAFVGHEGNMKIQERLISHIVQSCIKNCKKELESLKRDVDALKKVETPFPRISYTEAIDTLNKEEVKIEWGEDFGAPHERIISEKFDKPVIVHRYPQKIKAFYMQPDPENPKVVLCNDMLAPEGYGEIIGGSERIWDLKTLEKRLKDWKLKKEDYEWYLDLRKYGSIPHSGFGLGVERVVAWICKLDHIRETIPFARTIKRLYP